MNLARRLRDSLPLLPFLTVVVIFLIIPTVTVVIGRRIAFALAMTSARNASRLAFGQGQDARVTLLMSL